MFTRHCFSLPPHLLLSAVGLVVLGWASKPQYLREGSLEFYLSCRPCSSVGYGRQLLALSLGGCWISVSSSSWTCLKWPSCNVLCCVSFDLCLFMEGLPVMCVLTGVRACLCEWAIKDKNVFRVEKAIFVHSYVRAPLLFRDPQWWGIGNYLATEVKYSKSRN